MKNKNHLIIDCSSIAYAAFFTAGNLSYNGEQTGVIYGFLRKTLTLAKKCKTNKLYFCFDSEYSKRKEEYPEYKRSRKERLKKLSGYERSQLLRMVEQREKLYNSILPQIGFKNCFQRYGYEADDLIAILVEILYNQGKKCIIISSDNDMYQCLDKADMVCPRKMERMTEKILIREYGVEANKWPMCKAIGGCSGDDVIGIRGIADPKKKTSKALKYMQDKLKENTEIFKRIHSNKGEDTIRRNLPIVSLPYKPDKMIPIVLRRDRITKYNLSKVFGQYDFKSLLKRDLFKYWEEIFLS